MDVCMVFESVSAELQAEEFICYKLQGFPSSKIPLYVVLMVGSSPSRFEFMCSLHSSLLIWVWKGRVAES